MSAGTVSPGNTPKTVTATTIHITSQWLDGTTLATANRTRRHDLLITFGPARRRSA
jgi:hypothetical protein